MQSRFWLAIEQIFPLNYLHIQCLWIWPWFVWINSLPSLSRSKIDPFTLPATFTHSLPHIHVVLFILYIQHFYFHLSNTHKWHIRCSFRVLKYLAQGRFRMPTEGTGDKTTDLLISGRSAIPSEPPLDPSKKMFTNVSNLAGKCFHLGYISVLNIIPLTGVHYGVKTFSSMRGSRLNTVESAAADGAGTVKRHALNSF